MRAVRKGRPLFFTAAVRLRRPLWVRVGKACPLNDLDLQTGLSARYSVKGFSGPLTNLANAAFGLGRMLPVIIRETRPPLGRKPGSLSGLSADCGSQ